MLLDEAAISLDAFSVIEPCHRCYHLEPRIPHCSPHQCSDEGSTAQAGELHLLTLNSTA
jgi:hypothetical protein